MPTAAKLIAALIFGATAGAAVFQGLPELPDTFAPRYLLPWAVLVGFWMGWKVMGARCPRRNFGRAFTVAVTTLILSVIATLSGAAIYEMLYRATKKRYGDSMGEAFGDAASLFVDYLTFAAIPAVLTPLAIGTLVATIVVPLSKRAFN